MKKALLDTWLEKSAEEAREVLAKPDVFVTNKKDKEVQLVKLKQLDEEVKSILVNLKWYDIHEDGMVVRDDGNARRIITAAHPV